MKKIFLLLNCCILLTSSNFCLNDKISYNEQINKTEREMSAIAQFSLDFLLRSIHQDENTVCSPISVHNIFTLLANGAEGDVLKKMKLMLGDDIVKLNEYYKDHFKNYKSKGLTFSNLLWVDEKLILNDLFSDKCNDFPLTQIRNIDLSSKEAKDIINEWIDSCTNHTIKNIVENINSRNKLIATSALYFKSNWAFPFLKENSITDKFFSSKGGITQVEYMQSIRNYRYFKDKKSKCIILPYEKSYFSFFLLLPNENILLKDFLRTISGTELLKIFQNGQKNYTAVNLYLPKFKIEYSSNDLMNVLTEMGFNPMYANFSSILKDKESLYLSDICQKTFLSIDENGTEASSATVVCMDAGTVKKKIKSIELKFNRPFIFGILENQTNIPLFIGAINEL